MRCLDFIKKVQMEEKNGKYQVEVIFKAVGLYEFS